MQGPGGGEWDAELTDVLERKHASVALTARLQEERTTTDEHVALLTTDVLRLGILSARWNT